MYMLSASEGQKRVSGPVVSCLVCWELNPSLLFEVRAVMAESISVHRNIVFLWHAFRKRKSTYLITRNSFFSYIILRNYGTTYPEEVWADVCLLQLGHRWHTTETVPWLGEPVSSLGWLTGHSLGLPHLRVYPREWGFTQAVHCFVTWKGPCRSYRFLIHILTCGISSFSPVLEEY